MHMSQGRHPDDRALWAFYSDVLAGVRSLPGVVAAGVATEIPVRDGFGCTVQGFEDEAIYTRINEAGLTTCAGQVPATPGYFEALGIPVLAGRVFEDGDNDQAERATVVVSQAFADRFWPGEDPLGKGVAPSGRTEGPFYHVIGVVGDVPAGSVEGETAMAIYYPIVMDPATPGNWGFWWPGSVTLVVRTSQGDPTAILPAVRQVVSALDPEVPLANLESMGDVVSRSMGRVTFTSLLLAIAAGTALLLAAVGLYGVVSYTVTRGRREIGMRMAIGARPKDVERLIVRRSLTLAGLGLLVGVAASLAGTRLLAGILYGVAPTDPRVFGAAGALLMAVTLVASWLPAHRAARIDPSEALRSE
jgi:predicted permease